MARRVLDPFNDGYYEHAVFDAFKVLESRLRDVLNKPGANFDTLLDEAFNSSRGTLHDPTANGSERQGAFMWFKSAWALFRNCRAHGFVDTDEEEAFDLILMANRMLLTIEERAQLRQPRITTSDYPALFFMDKLSFFLDEHLMGRKTFLLDADNDGEKEIIVLSGEEGEIFKVFKNVQGNSHTTEVEKLGTPHSIVAAPPHESFDIFLADVDNDGKQEIVCSNRWAYNTGLLFYKYRDGKYVILRKDPEDAATDDFGTPWFINAYITDLDVDGEAEIVSEPKEVGYLPPPARYIWKWNEEAQFFQLISQVEFAKRTQHPAS